MIRELFARVRDRLRRDSLDRELSEELAFHRRQLERDAVHAGASETEAHGIANRALGNTTLVRESAREAWSFPWLERILGDFKYALRGLRRSPGFTATVVITLGLGIGATSTMFGVVDRLMYRPLAYLEDPGTVRRVYWRWTDRNRVVTSQSAPYTRYLDLQRGTTAFAQFAVFSEQNLAVGEGQTVREQRVGLVSASYFDLFSARPVIGRFFVAEEDVTPRGAAVAVLSHAFWRSEFGGRNVLGEALQVGNVRTEIIGVAPPGFAGVNDANPPAIWIPITTFAGSEGTADAQTYFTHYRWGWTHTLVRLKPGVALEQASAQATAAFAQSWDRARLDEPGRPMLDGADPQVLLSAVRPGAGPAPALEARTALWVTAVAAIVLIIAAANVANLFVARALRRQRETAVRLALGASGGRLLSQSIVESVVLAFLSAAAAMFISRWGGAAIGSLLNTGPTVALEAGTDWRTLGVTFLVALVVGVVIGMIPALLARRGDLSRTLRGGARSGVAHGQRIRAVLLVVQAALSTVLLIGAVLFQRSLAAVRAMPMGYDAEHVVLVNRVLRGPWPGEPAIRTMAAQLVGAAQALPEVEAAAWVASAPFVSTSNVDLFVAGIDSVGSLGAFTYQVTTPDYFRAMSTRIVRGRGLSADDRVGAPNAAVVSESMARVLWPGGDALGQCFRMRADTMPCITVVGIAEDMVQRDLTGTQRYHYYIPLDQSTRTLGNWMVIRLRGDPAVEGERVRQALQRVLPSDAYLTVRRLGAVVQDAQRSWRLGATMFALFGALALVVAAIGLYGVISYNVTQRLHELAVRAALGASRARIVRLVIAQSVRFVVIGVAAGLVIAATTGRWVEPLLFRQSATDPAVYLGVAALMLAVAFIASALPAARASGADPATALRAE